MHGRAIFCACLGVCVGFLNPGARTVAASGTGGNAAATAAMAHQQVDVPLHAPSDALDLGLMTVTNDLAYFAGQYVRISNARVYEVMSPRVFSIELSTVPSSHMRYYDNRALVVLASPVSTTITKGTLVEVVGRPWTLVGAEARLDRTALAELNPRVIRRFEHKPFIGADLVRTPDGIQLYGR